MKIFGFAKKVFFVGLTAFSAFTNANSWSCISVSNQVCKTRLQVVNVNGDEPMFFLFSTETSKCSCINIIYPYARICVRDLIKNLNAEVFNPMSRTNETRYIAWHKTCKCDCKFGKISCNIKQSWNKNNCR